MRKIVNLIPITSRRDEADEDTITDLSLSPSKIEDPHSANVTHSSVVLREIPDELK